MVWLTGWNRRKSKIINGSTVGTQTNYQMKLTIHKSSGTDTATDIYLGVNVRDDFGDIRFTSSDGSTLLNYWIESYVPANYAIIWVLIPNIPISPGTTTIYIYYNNPLVSSASDGNTTFDFFDDFSGDLSKWTILTGNWVISGGILQQTNNGGEFWARGLRTTNAISLTGRAVAMKIRFDDTSGNRHIAFSGKWNDGTEGLQGGHYLHTEFRIESPSKVRDQAQNGSWRINYDATYTFSFGIWYTVETKISSTGNVNTTINGTSQLSFTDEDWNQTWPYVNLQTYFSRASYDDVRVRKYVVSEPTFGITGIEETPGCPLSPKYEGDTVHLSATPKDGTGPYYVEFRKNNAPIASTSGVIENTEVTYDYILTNEDIRTAYTGTIDFLVYIEDLCPTTHQTCTQVCTVNIGCIAPVCNFQVT